MPAFVLSEIRQRVGIIILNRPEILNAWHRAMREELKVLLKRFQDSPDIEAIVLTGSGEWAFCAGQDLNETKDFDHDGIEDWMREWEVLNDCISGLEKPLEIELEG